MVVATENCVGFGQSATAMPSSLSLRPEVCAELVRLGAPPARSVAVLLPHLPHPPRHYSGPASRTNERRWGRMTQS